MDEILAHEWLNEYIPSQDEIIIYIKAKNQALIEEMVNRQIHE